METISYSNLGWIEIRGVVFVHSFSFTLKQRTNIDAMLFHNKHKAYSINQSRKNNPYHSAGYSSAPDDISNVITVWDTTAEMAKKYNYILFTVLFHINELIAEMANCKPKHNQKLLLFISIQALRQVPLYSIYISHRYFIYVKVSTTFIYI